MSVDNKNKISKEVLNEIFEYKDGVLFWRRPTHPRIKIGTRVGCVTKSGNSSYIGLELFRMSCKAHRLIWIMHFGDIPEGMVIDHVDGNGLNNELSNLRLATHEQNHQNSTKRKGSKSRFKGVSWHKGQRKWNAVIQIDGTRYHLGSHDTEEEAHAEYCAVANEIFGEFFNAGK